MQGGKKKRRGKNNNNNMLNNFIAPTESQFYAKVIKNTGSCRFELQVFYYSFKINENKNGNLSKKTLDRDSMRPEDILFKMEKKIGSVRGAMMRRNYVNAGDIILVSERDFQPSIVDIIHVYKSFHHHNIRRCKFAPPELFDGGIENDVKFMEDDSKSLSEDCNSDSDIDTNFDYIPRNRYKEKHTGSNHDYMSMLDLPEQNFDEDNEGDENNSNNYQRDRETDALGNYI